MRALYCLSMLFTAASASTASSSACPAAVAQALEFESSDGASVSLLQSGAVFAQHTIVTAEVDANAEVVETFPLADSVYLSAGAEEVSLLSVAPKREAADTAATPTTAPPGAPMPRTPSAAALALAKMVKEDAQDAEATSLTYRRASQRGRAQKAGEKTVWRYKPYNKLMADIRAVPSVSGERTEFEIQPGAMFRVQEEIVGDDGITYLKLADGRGWLFDRLANGGVMCMREETPRDIGAALLETVSKIRSGFQATSTKMHSGQSPRGHRGSRLTHLLIPVALILCTIIFFLVISRFARPAPVEVHVRPRMRHWGISQDTYKPDGVVRTRSPQIRQNPQQRQSFNLITGNYEAAPTIFPPVQSQVIQQQQPVRQTSSPAVGRPVPSMSIASSRGRSPPSVRSAVTWEAGTDLRSRPLASARILGSRPVTRQLSAPPGSLPTMKAGMNFDDQWSPSPSQQFHSMQSAPRTVPVVGSAQAVLLRPTGR